MRPGMEKFEQRLRDLVPLESMSPALQDELFAVAEIVEYPQGRFVFREGDTDDYNYYLLEGELEMSTHGTVANRYVGGSDTCRYPLAQLRPRKFSAQVARPAVVFRVDRRHLDELQRRQSSGGTGVIELEEEAGGSGDWMSSMLQSELFSRIPATNLQRLFAAVDYIEVPAGEEIITQGDPGDFYYIIHQGTCDVLVEPKSGGKKVKVATLKPNDSFGEEALVTDAARNATIRMTSPGHLLRLGKQDFQALIRDVLLESVSFEKAEGMVAEGARWLDVRFAEDFEKVSIPGALNIPFNVLRLRADELDSDIRYITYCNNGLRSSVAAFLLIQRGFDVCFLNRGLENSPLAGRLADQGIGVAAAPGSGAPASLSPESPAPAAAAPGAPSVPATDKAQERLREDLEKTRNQLEQVLRMKREADAARRSFEKMVEQKFNLAKQKIREEAGKAAKAREEAARLGRELEAARSEAAEGDKLRQLAEDHAAQLEEQRTSLEGRFQEELKVARSEWEDKEQRLMAEGAGREDELDQLRQELNEVRGQAVTDVEEAVERARQSGTQERATLVAELESLKGRQAALEEDKAGLEGQLASVRENASDAGQEVQALARERDEAKAAQEALGREVRALEEERDALAAEATDLKAENAEVAAERERLGVERETAGQQLAAVEKDLAAARDEVAAAHASRDEDQATLAGERDAARQRIHELEGQITAQQQEWEDAQRVQAEERAADQAALSQERDAARQRADELEGQITARQQEWEDAQRIQAEERAADRAALSQERDAARQRAYELERQLEALGQEGEASRQRADELERQLEVQTQEREEEQRRLAAEGDDARRRAEALETELATLQEELEQERAAAAAAQDTLSRERDELAERVKTAEESLAVAREGGDAAARDAGERARQAEQALSEARAQWEEERAALESQLAEANAVMGEFDKLREDMEGGRRAVQEAAERQEQELDSLEQTLRREAQEALENERERLEREFDERLAKARASWQADVGVDTAGDVAAFMAGDERVDRLEAELATTRQELTRVQDALKFAELARDAAEKQVQQSRETVASSKEELPDDQNRLVDPAKIRELMERRRELLKRQSDKKG